MVWNGPERLDLEEVSEPTVDPDLVGRTVAVNPLSSDGTCPLCRAGHTNPCPNRKLIGIHSPGGFAELVRGPSEQIKVFLAAGRGE